MTGSGATYRAEIVYGGACTEVTWRVHSSEPIGDDKWSRMMAPVAHPRHCMVLMRVITETSSTPNHVSDCITVNAVRRSGSRGKCRFAVEYTMSRNFDYGPQWENIEIIHGAQKPGSPQAFVLGPSASLKSPNRFAQFSAVSDNIVSS